MPSTPVLPKLGCRRPLSHTNSDTLVLKRIFERFQHKISMKVLKKVSEALPTLLAKSDIPINGRKSFFVFHLLTGPQHRNVVHCCHITGECRAMRNCPCTLPSPLPGHPKLESRCNLGGRHNTFKKWKTVGEKKKRDHELSTTYLIGRVHGSV